MAKTDVEGFEANEKRRMRVICCRRESRGGRRRFQTRVKTEGVSGAAAKIERSSEGVRK